MSEYVRKTESELARMGEGQLLAWIGTARDAGDLEAAKQCSGRLAYLHEKRVRDKVRLRTPNAYVEDVVMEVMESAVRSAFDGKFIGEFHSWINTITRRRIADFHESQKRLPDTTLLPGEHQEGDGIWVTLGVEETEMELLPYREIADRLLTDRNEIHRAAVKLYGPVELGFLEYDAESTATEVNRLFPHGDPLMSSANVHQIWRRFKRDFAEALEAADSEGEDL